MEKKYQKGVMEQRQLNFMQSLKDKFPKHKVKSFDWPQITDQAMTIIVLLIHIFLIIVETLIIHEANQTVSNENFQAALFDSIHEEYSKIIKRQVIVGDETGTTR